METAPSSPEPSGGGTARLRAGDLRFLREQSWVALTLLVALLVPAFWHLSTWQFHRLDARRMQNSEVAAATANAPRELSEVIKGRFGRAVPDWTPVWVDVRWEPVNLMARKRWRDDVMGFWAVSPARTSAGTLLCVRGWVPTTRSAATTPTIALPPSTAVGSDGVRLRGWLIEADEGVQAPGLPAGQISRVNKTAWPGMAGSALSSVVLVLDHAHTEGSAFGAAPGLYDLTPPTPSEGPHHSYAWQWRAFIVLVLVGWARLVLNEARVHAATRASTMSD